jgi:DNA-binding transcriptional ArsR family regulator
MAPDFEHCTPYLKALAEGTRWHIVQELLADPLTAAQLGERLKVSQYNVSKHLRVLREAGIVETARRGKSLYCQIVPAFQRKVAKGKNQLDLGCCVFWFDKRSR